VRVLLATLAVAGCSFEHGVQQGTGGQVDDPTMPDAQVSTIVMCNHPDPALRLCVEFADGNYSTATDGSQYHMNPDTQDVAAAMRGPQRAAATYWNSVLAVPENTMLDISSAITFEAWVAIAGFTPYHNAKLVQNQDQYEISLDREGKITCRVGTLSAKCEYAVGKDMWRHVACTFDGSELRLYLDGAASKCQSGTTAIPTAGLNGTRLVNDFTGVVDDLRIYARGLSPAEICSHADKSACASSCD
jgi:hypothetical protein